VRPAECQDEQEQSIPDGLARPPSLPERRRYARGLRDRERTYHRRRRQVAVGRLTPVEHETIMTPQATQAA